MTARRPGRPLSAARGAAREAGESTYQGAPCKRGHAGRRYASTAACVDCVAGRPDGPGSDGRDPGAVPAGPAAIAASILV